MKLRHLFLILITTLLCATQMMAAAIPDNLIGQWVTLKTENGWYFYAIEEGGQIKLGQTQVAPKGDGVVAATDPHHYSNYCWYIEGNETTGYTFRCLHYENGVKKYIANPATLATNYNEVILADEGSKYLYTDNHQLQLVANKSLYLAFYSQRYSTIRLHDSANYIGSKMIIGGVYEWSVAAVVYGTETEDGDGHPQGTYLPKGGVTYGGQEYKHGSSLYVGDVSSGFSVIDLTSDGFTKSTIKIDEENKYIVAYYVGTQSGINYKTAPVGGVNAVTGENNTIWQMEARNYITNTSTLDDGVTKKYTTVPAGKAWQMEMVVQNTNIDADTPDPSFNRWGSCILSSCGDPLNTYYWGEFQVYQHAPTHSSPNTLNFKSSKGDGMDHIIAEGNSVDHKNYKVIVRYNGGNIYLIRTIILGNELSETNTVYNNVWVAAQQQNEISQMSCALPTGLNLKSLAISIAEESNLLEGVDYAIQNIVGKQYLTGGNNEGTNWYSTFAGNAAKFQIEWTNIPDLTYGLDGGLHHSFYIKIVDSNKYIGPNNTIVDTKAQAQAFIYATNNKIAPITAKNTLGTAWTIGENDTWEFDFFANFYVEVAGNNAGGLKYKKNNTDQTATNGQYIELPSGVAVNQLANSSQAGFSAAISKQDIRLKTQYTPLENTFYNITDKSASATTLYYWYKSANKLITYSTKNSLSGLEEAWGEKGDCSKFTIAKAPSIPMSMSNIGGKYYNTVYCPNALSLPAGVKAYRLSKVTAGKFGLKEIELSDNLLPANSPVVLISNAAVSSTDWTISTTPTTPVADNKFAGVFMQTANPGSGEGLNSSIFVLGNKTSGIGFYHYTAAKIPAFKVYYVDETDQASLDPQSNAKKFSFLFEDEATSIKQISEKVNDDTVIYDLMGRRISKIQNGRIYIVNGKKIHM